MSKELTTVATAGDVSEAEFLRNHLEDAGFEAYIADNNIVGANYLLAPAVGWIKIKVPLEEAEAAARLIDDLRNAEIVYDENFPDPGEEK